MIMQYMQAYIGNSLQNLKKGNFEFNDTEFSGRLQKLQTDEMEEVLGEDAIQTIHEVRTESINSNILYTNLGKSQKFEKWAPHKFIKEYLNTCFFFSFFCFFA